LPLQCLRWLHRRPELAARWRCLQLDAGVKQEGLDQLPEGGRETGEPQAAARDGDRGNTAFVAPPPSPKLQRQNRREKKQPETGLYHVWVCPRDGPRASFRHRNARALPPEGTLPG